MHATLQRIAERPEIRATAGIAVDAHGSGWPEACAGLWARAQARARQLGGERLEAVELRSPSAVLVIVAAGDRLGAVLADPASVTSLIRHELRGCAVKAEEAVAGS